MKGQHRADTCSVIFDRAYRALQKVRCLHRSPIRNPAELRPCRGRGDDHIWSPTVDLKKLTKIELTQRLGWMKPSNMLTVKVGDTDVMSWMQTDDSTTDSPQFTGLAQFKYEQWRVFTDKGWQDQIIDGNETEATVFPLSMIEDATDSAISDMFGDVSRLKVIGADHRSFSVTLDGKEVVEFRDEYGSGEFYCFPGDVAEMPDGGLVFTFYSATRYGWNRWLDGDASDDVETYREDQLGKIIPHAYRALVNGWIDLS